MANYRNYNGPNCAGAPKNKIPDWLDHTMNAETDQSQPKSTTPAETDPGPNQPLAMSISKGT